MYSGDSSQGSILNSMHTTIQELQAQLTQFLDTNNEIDKLKLENFNLKLEHDTDKLEIAVLKLEYDIDMLDIQVCALLG